jgi:hypothetical protein
MTPATPMTLYEALAAARHLNIPQGTDAFYSAGVEESPCGFCACAIGQALIAAGRVTMDEARGYARGMKAFPAFDRLPQAWDVGWVFEMNDTARASITEIARVAAWREGKNPDMTKGEDS